MNLERGYFVDDAVSEPDFRTALAERVRTGVAIFPNRTLGLGFAAINSGLPRGYPVAEVAVANLKVGESFPLNGRKYTVLSAAKTIKFRVEHKGAELKDFRTSPDHSNWG